MAAMTTQPQPPVRSASPIDRRRTVHFREVLGKGGFGAVYLADLVSTDDFVQRVAIKVMSAEMLDVADFAARQRDEARLLGRIVHENVVRVMDLTEIDGRPAVIMEYVEGADLAQLLARGPLPPRAAFQAVARVAGALQAVRTSPDPQTGLPLDVVHRDIKPANVLLTPHGGVKVLDFGIARADFAREGRTGSVQFGTTRYMAPEQWLYSAVSHKIDIYALGITLCEALVGRPVERPPLEAVRYDDHMDAVVDHVVQPDWPPGARSLLRSMLAYEPDQRPDASAVADACLQLADAVPGQSLTRVARSRVPELVALRRERFVDHAMPQSTGVDQPVVRLAPPTATGATVRDGPDERGMRPVFVGSADPHAPTLVRPLSAPGSLRRRRPAVALAAVVVVVLAGALAWWSSGSPEPAWSPAAEAVPAEVPRELPSAPAEATVQAAEATVQAAEATVQAAETPEPAAAPAATAPEPEAAPPPEPRAAASRAPAPRPVPDEPAPSAEPSVPPAPGPSEPSTDPAPSVESAPARPRASGPPLPVTLTSTPYGAAVFVDGASIPGTTPLRELPLAAGRHEVRIVGPGGSCSGSIRVSAARANTFVCTLDTGTLSARQ